MQAEDEAFTGVDPVTFVRCCICGLLVEANPSNMCANCIRAHVDITDGLLKEYTLIYCPECQRYLQPPKYWSKAELESRELMTVCLKKIKGLNKYNLVDASFLWTEPHSKRLKLKIILEKEIFSNTVIQQTVPIEYEVMWQQCERCQKAATGQPQWDSVVQLRQKVEHKRTFLFLEQIILKHRMHEDVTKIDAHPDGLDFFYNHKSHAQAFVDFISAQAPVLRCDATQLVSHDSKNNIAVQHHTFSLEIAPPCREDLVFLPPFFFNKMGHLGPLVLVHKVYSSMVFVDPITLRAGELLGTFFWKHPFSPLANTRRMIEFYVIDIELTGVVNGRFQQALATVCLSSEVGQGREWVVHTHLGAILQPGDLVKGYLLSSLNVNNSDLDAYKHQANLPDVILVHKHFPNQAARRHLRRWRLKHLDVDVKGGDKDQLEREKDEFADELERDKEFRKDIPIYLDPTKKKKAAQETEEDNAVAAAEGEAEIELAEMLDELNLEETEKQRPKRSRE